MNRFPIRFGRFNAVFLGLLGMGHHWSYVDVGPDTLVVHMGWAFRATIDRSAVVSAEARDYVWWAYGVHGNGRGRWIVNGSGHNIVAVRIDPPARGHVLGFPVKLRELWVSLDDPQGLLGAL